MASRSLPVVHAHLAPRRSLGAGQVWAFVVAMLEVRRTRRLLAEMEPRLLADIGTSPGDASIEASRPFWDLAPRRR